MPKALLAVSGSFKATSTSWQYTGTSITVPAGHTYIMNGRTRNSSGRPVGIALSASSSIIDFISLSYLDGTEQVSRTPAVCVSNTETIYLWEKRERIPDSSNQNWIFYVDILN